MSVFAKLLTVPRVTVSLIIQSLFTVLFTMTKDIVISSIELGKVTNVLLSRTFFISPNRYQWRIYQGGWWGWGRTVVQWLARLNTNPLARVRSWTRIVSTQLTQLFIPTNGLVDKWVPRETWGRQTVETWMSQWPCVPA